MDQIRDQIYIGLMRVSYHPPITYICAYIKTFVSAEGDDEKLMMINIFNLYPFAINKHVIKIKQNRIGSIGTKSYKDIKSRFDPSCS
jgi:hypothetical protein